MRVGIFDPYLDDLGGGEKYMMTLAQCLSRNHSVTVFWDNKQDLKKISERFSLDTSKITIKNNIFSSGCSFFKRCIESLNYDAIICLSDGSIPFVLSKKLFIHIQQPFPDIKMSVKSKLKKMRVNSFFCNSYFTKSFIDKEFGINSKVIYPPVEIKKTKTKKENIILHVGRFRAINAGTQDYKKQETMVAVFKRMIDEGLKNWRFILAVGLRESDKSQFNKLQKDAKGYPIQFLVNLNNKDLDKVYAKAKIYWHASGFGEDLGNNPQFAEHFGISTVEAMVKGTVPVVINAGGQKEIVKEGENGFLWDSIEELKSKTLKLIEDEPLLNKFSKQSAKDAEKFSKEKFCREINSLVLQ